MTASGSPVLPPGYRLPATLDGLLAECDVSVFQSSGAGGQHRNRAFSSVRLRHLPSGLVVIGRRQRSQHQNKADALKRLAARLERMLEPVKPRRPTRPSRSSKEKRLTTKRKHSQTKRLRGSDFDE